MTASTLHYEIQCKFSQYSEVNELAFTGLDFIWYK